MDALSGNNSDKESFRQTLNAHLEHLHDGVGLSLSVADSALYTAKKLQDLGDFPWITRVLETIGGTRELILAASGEWMETRPERTYTVLCLSYGGVKQRWLVVYTQAAHHGRAEQTVNKQHLKQSQAEYKAFNVLAKLFYSCQQPTGGIATQSPRHVGALYARPTKSRTGLSLFEGSLVHGEYTVSQVAKAHHGGV